MGVLGIKLARAQLAACDLSAVSLTLDGLQLLPRASAPYFHICYRLLCQDRQL